MDKFYKCVCVTAPVFSILTAGTILFGLEALPALLISSIGAGVVSPIAYLGLNHFEEKTKRDGLNSSLYFKQCAHMIFENKEEYRLINEDTNYFYDYIERSLNGGMMPTTLKVDEQSLENINQFLHLINSNYFYKINSTSNLKREQVVALVSNEVVRYLNSKKQSSFSHKDVKEVLKSCSCIDDELKKDIEKEYKKGRFNFNGNIVYAVSKDRNRYNGIGNRLFLEENDFDLNNSSNYSLIIEYVCSSNEYKKYKSLLDLGWDIESLKRMIQVIDCEFGKDIKLARGTYSKLDLVTSFVINTINCVVKEDKKEVGIDELFCSLSTWDYLPKKSMNREVVLALKEDFLKSKNKEKSIGGTSLK